MSETITPWRDSLIRNSVTPTILWLPLGANSLIGLLITIAAVVLFGVLKRRSPPCPSMVFDEPFVPRSQCVQYREHCAGLGKTSLEAGGWKDE